MGQKFVIQRNIVEFQRDRMFEESFFFFFKYFFFQIIKFVNGSLSNQRILNESCLTFQKLFRIPDKRVAKANVLILKYVCRSVFQKLLTEC